MATYSVGTYGGGSTTVLPPVFGVGQERLTLDGLELNDGNPWTILREPAFEFQQAPKKLNFAESPLADGAALVGDDDHYQNAEMIFAVTASTQVSVDAALAAFHALTQKLQEARRTPGEMPLVWTKAGSSDSLTFYLHDAEYEEIDASRSGGWFSNTVSLTIHLYLRPFGYGAEQQAELGYTEPFTWDSISGGRWRFGSGSGLSVSNNALVPTSSGTKLIYLPFQTTDANLVARVAIGSTTTGTQGGVLRYLDSSNYLGGRITAGNALQIHMAGSSLASTSFSPSATFYWLSFSVNGDDVDLTVYAGDQNPLTDLATPLASVSYTLPPGHALGAGTIGNPGLHIITAGTAAQYAVDEFNLRGMGEIKSAEPLFHFEVVDVKGHVPAEARLVVTEGGGVSKAHFEFGEETRNYVQGSPLILDSEVLTIGSSTRATVAGNYTPLGSGTNTVRSQPLSQDSAIKVCTTDIQGHVGSYKVKARVRGVNSAGTAGVEGIRMRLAWQAGDTEFVRNAYTPGTSGVYQELDLGTIIVDQSVLGVHFWLGKIEAYSPETAGAKLEIDYLLLIPQERYGVARAPLVPVVGDAYALLDNFLQTDGALTGKGLEVPNENWSTTAHTSPNGPSGDYQVVNSLNAVERTTIKDGWTFTGTPQSGTLDITAISSADVARMNDADSYFAGTGPAPDTIYGTGIPAGAFVQTKLTTTSIRISGTNITTGGTPTSLIIGNPNYGRFALAGGTSYAAVQLQVTCEGRQTSSGLNNIPIDGKIRMGLLARYSGPENWVACVRENYAVQSIEYSRLRVYKRVSGVTTLIGSKPEPGTRLGDRRTIIFTIDTAGVWQAYSFAAGSLPPGSPLISGQDDVLASGGARNTGLVGLFDVFANPYVDNITRRYLNFSGFTATSGVVMNASQGMEIRSDTAERASASGLVWGKVPMYRGERFLIPPEGDNQYITRIAAKARRLNVDEGLTDKTSVFPPTSFALDPITVSVFISPRYLHLAGQNTGGF